MKPEIAIAALDRQIAAHGQPVTLYRYTGQTREKVDEVSVRAFVRPVKNDDLVGDIRQDDIKVVLSPTGLGAMAALRKGDKVMFDGRERNIEFSGPIHLDGALVRYNAVVRG